MAAKYTQQSMHLSIEKLIYKSHTNNYNLEYAAERVEV